MQERGKKRGRRRSVQALAAAEDVLPALVRSFVQAGLKPKALRQVFEQAMTDCQEAPVSSFGEAHRQDFSDLAHVLSVWHTDPRFVDPDGRPRALRQTGRLPSFGGLARMASPALPVEEVLKKLLIAGAVEVDSKDRVRALRRELISRRWDELGLWTWQQAVRRLLETLEFNYTVPGLGRFERTAHSERLPARLLPVFNGWIREHGGEFLQMADDWLMQHKRPSDRVEEDDTVTTGVGIYLFVDEPDSRNR